MPAWLSDRRSRRGDGEGSNGSNDDAPEPTGHVHSSFERAHIEELRRHLRICRCSLGGAWAALLDDVEGAGPSSEPEPPAPEPERTPLSPNGVRLVDAHVTITTEGQARADVWLEVSGTPLHGHGLGATALGGRHVAVARAAVDALRPVVGSDAALESMTLSADHADADAVHVLATVTAAQGRWAGAATSPPDREEWGAALAVLDAVRTHLHTEPA